MKGVLVREESFHKNVEKLLQKAGWLDTDSYRLFHAGENKREKIFRIEGLEDDLMLKRYYKTSENDKALINEFQFATFAWSSGIRSIAQPLVCDRERKICVYKFIEGRPLSFEDLQEQHICEALDFLQKLKQDLRYEAASHLPLAAEACFSLQAHLLCVERRLELLAQQDKIIFGGNLKSFVKKDLQGLWTTIKKRVLRAACVLEHDLEASLPRQQWCLSPGDFGFHNALLTKEGSLKFTNFFHSGWDDPCRVLCDFFCQQAFPVPLKYYDVFVDGLFAHFEEKQVLLERMRLLLPVYRFKWCLILLNEYLPQDDIRRFFAMLEHSMSPSQLLERAQQLASALAKDLNAKFSGD